MKITFNCEKEGGPPCATTLLSSCHRAFPVRRHGRARAVERRSRRCVVGRCRRGLLRRRRARDPAVLDLAAHRRRLGASQIPRARTGSELGVRQPGDRLADHNRAASQATAPFRRARLTGKVLGSFQFSHSPAKPERRTVLHPDRERLLRLLAQRLNMSLSFDLPAESTPPKSPELLPRPRFLHPTFPP